MVLLCIHGEPHSLLLRNKGGCADHTTHTRKSNMENTTSPETSFPMKGGDGPLSYANNSSLQRTLVDASKQLFDEVIAKTLDMEKIGIGPNCTTFTIADLGCSTGPNTFYAMQAIIDVVKSKHRAKWCDTLNLEFQVYFNDHISNDFNMLFRSLPLSHEYYAVGVPNSFYKRLFPKSSIHLIYSSSSLNWLSRVPEEVNDPNSLAWNEGRIYYATKEVINAYSCQFKKDMESFLRARAEEVVSSGLMMLLMGGLSVGVAYSDTFMGKSFDILRSCLIKMTNKGLISKEKVDSFNLPIYHPSVEELKEVINKVNYFTIERIEEQFLESKKIVHDIRIMTSHIRAALEGLITNHFGDQIVEELFEDYVTENINEFDKNNTKFNSNFVLILKRM